MTNKVNKLMAVIPAGGQAIRFGGIYKELLPIGSGEFLLSNALYTAKTLGASDYVILSSKTKIQAHMDFVEQYAPEYDIKFITSNDWPELWEAIASTLVWHRDTLLILPDTIVDIDPKQWNIPRPHNIHFRMGLFNTNQPERFSVLINNNIFTKDEKLSTSYGYRNYKAWGIVQWSAEVSAYLDMMKFNHYDGAFQAAINEYGLETFHINNYYDLGNWEAYKAFTNR